MEEKVYTSVINWVKHEPSERKKFVARVSKVETRKHYFHSPWENEGPLSHACWEMLTLFFSKASDDNNYRKQGYKSLLSRCITEQSLLAAVLLLHCDFTSKTLYLQSLVLCIIFQIEKQIGGASFFLSHVVSRDTLLSCQVASQPKSLKRYGNTLAVFRPESQNANGIWDKELYVCVCLAAEDTRQSLQGICEEMKGKMRINHAEIKEGSACTTG